MKVFACRRQGRYSGGLIIVAAKTKEEAYDTFLHDDGCECFVDAHTPDGDWCEPDDENAIVSTDYYPYDKWYEIGCLTADVQEPQVIAQDGYTE